MANKNQIMIVKTIRKRLIELLGDSKVSVTVSYTSSTDTLRLTFKKILKGEAFVLPICTSMKLYLLIPETLQYIVTDALDKMPKPSKWESMSALFTELRRRRDDYQTYTLQLPYGRYAGSYFSASFTSQDDATVALYGICCHSCARDYRFNTTDLDLFESSFERDAGLASGGEYTRWREAGEPKRWTDPTEVRHIVPGRPDIDIRSIEINRNPETCQGASASAVWLDEIHGIAAAPDFTNWYRMFNTACPIGMSVNNQSMRYYTFDSLGGELPAPSTQEPTNE